MKEKFGMSHDRRIQRQEHILRLCHSMKPGQAVRFDLGDIREFFPCGWPSIYRTPIECLLSNLVGSAWGGFMVSEDLQGNIIVSRHEEGERRVYVDPDREHLFRKTPDGYLELI